MMLELTKLQPMERNRATAKKLNGFREILDEVNQLLALAGDTVAASSSMIALQLSARLFVRSWTIPMTTPVVTHSTRLPGR